jgi:hypothetical protein
MPGTEEEWVLAEQMYEAKTIRNITYSSICIIHVYPDIDQHCWVIASQIWFSLMAASRRLSTKMLLRAGAFSK